MGHGHMTPVFTSHVGHQCITGANMGHVHRCPQWHPCSRAVDTGSVYLAPAFTGHVGHQCITDAKNMGHVHGCPKWHPWTWAMDTGSVYLASVFTGRVGKKHCMTMLFANTAREHWCSVHITRDPYPWAMSTSVLNDGRINGPRVYRALVNSQCLYLPRPICQQSWQHGLLLCSTRCFFSSSCCQYSLTCPQGIARLS